MTIRNHLGEDVTEDVAAELAGVLSRITRALSWPEKFTEEDKLALRIDYLRLEEIRQRKF